VFPEKDYNRKMIIIRFPDAATERLGVGFLVTRFSCTSWSTGETMVPEAALDALTAAGISFIVQGPATHEQLKVPLRKPAASTVL